MVSDVVIVRRSFQKRARAAVNRDGWVRVVFRDLVAIHRGDGGKQPIVFRMARF